MRPTGGRACRFQVVTLEGVTYAVLRESVLRAICQRAGVEPCSEAAQRPGGDADQITPSLDQGRLAERLRQRRLQAHLTQADLARRAGIRVETLNRIERGRTTPDFATVRKLVTAMGRAEAEQVTAALGPAKGVKR